MRIFPSIMRAIFNEVVATRDCNAVVASGCMSRRSATGGRVWAAFGGLQSLAPPDPLDPLVVHKSAGIAQQGRNLLVAVAAILPGKRRVAVAEEQCPLPLFCSCCGAARSLQAPASFTTTQVKARVLPRLDAVDYRHVIHALRKKPMVAIDRVIDSRRGLGVKVIRLDIAKSVFQVHGVNEAGRIVVAIVLFQARRR
jgi:hypothetical protein